MVKPVGLCTRASYPTVGVYSALPDPLAVGEGPGCMLTLHLTAVRVSFSFVKRIRVFLLRPSLKRNRQKDLAQIKLFKTPVTGIGHRHSSRLCFAACTRVTVEAIVSVGIIAIHLDPLTHEFVLIHHLLYDSELREPNSFSMQYTRVSSTVCPRGIVG